MNPRKLNVSGFPKPFFALFCLANLPNSINRLYDNRTMRLKELIKMLNKKLVGHYQYYGVSSNSRMTATYLHRAKQLLFKVLNRRSSRKSYLWDTFLEMLKTYPLAKPKIYFSLYT